MRIKKYIADSAKEALAQVREEMGPQAIILKTQKVAVKSFLGLGKHKIEVTAALDEGLFAKPESVPAGNRKTATLPELKIYNRRGEISQVQSRTSNAGGERMSDEKFRLLEIHEDVEEVKTVLRNLAVHLRHQQLPAMPEKITELCGGLIDHEISREIALKIVLKLQAALAEKEWDDENKIKDKACEIMASMISASGPCALKEKRAARIMLVGPTGMGKTTTLAKLASQYGILQRLRVRIITADTYRIAAVEQLRTFAQIADIPMEVVYSVEEMRSGLTKMSASSDLILIDTAGRSQHHEEHMEDLKNLVEAAQPDELHLVLSATTKESDLFETTDRYRLLGVNRYLFTKLDETKTYGGLYNLLAQTQVPFSYVTVGQSVPDDIEEGRAVRLAQMLLENENGR